MKYLFFSLKSTSYFLLSLPFFRGMFYMLQCMRTVLWKGRNFGTTLLNYSLELLFGNTLLNYSLELFFGTALWNYSLELLFVTTLWNYFLELLFGTTLWNYSKEPPAFIALLFYVLTIQIYFERILNSYLCCNLCSRFCHSDRKYLTPNIAMETCISMNLTPIVKNIIRLILSK